MSTLSQAEREFRREVFNRLWLATLDLPEKKRRSKDEPVYRYTDSEIEADERIDRHAATRDLIAEMGGLR